MTIFSKIRNFIYPEKNGTRIDMWKMDSESQTFGFWKNGSLAGQDCPPEKELKLVIQSYGNFKGNPNQFEFFQWLKKCRKNPDLFTLEEYNKKFL